MSTKRLSQFEYSVTGLVLIWVIVATILMLGMLTAPTNLWTVYLYVAASIMSILIITSLYIMSRYFIARISRNSMLSGYAREHLYSFGASDFRNYIDSLGVIAETAASYDDFTLDNVLKDSDWAYADFSYIRRGNVSYGSPILWRANYGILSVKIPRKLPNVFFDSRQSFGNQFKHHISKGLVHSLEGDFDHYFTTYFPKDYAIDSMSFITPEVMVSIRDAAEYDVEIFGDHIFLYGKQVTSIGQLEDMRSKASSIKHSLMNNLLTYRDARLPMEQGRLGVASKGTLLSKNKFWTIVSFGILGLYVLPYFVAFVVVIYTWITQGWNAADNLF